MLTRNNWLATCCLCFWAINLNGSAAVNQPFPCKRDTSSVLFLEDGTIAKKLGQNSKFVFVNRTPSANFFFQNAVEECRSLELELGRIRHWRELENLADILGKTGDFGKENVTFWIDGDLRGSTWVDYEGNPLAFAAFWGLTPKGVLTGKNQGPQNVTKIQLHWVNVNDTPHLLMMDVEATETFYLEKSFICEYPSSSECFRRSREEIHYLSEKNGLRLEEVNLEDANSISVSSIPVSRLNATNICTEGKLNVLQLKSQPTDLLRRALLNIIEKRKIPTNDSTGFWLGYNDLFTEESGNVWEWMDRFNGGRWGSHIFQSNGSFRTGQSTIPGKCLAFTVSPKNTTSSDLLLLQYVACDIPMFAVCDNNTRAPLRFSLTKTKSENGRTRRSPQESGLECQINAKLPRPGFCQQYTTCDTYGGRKVQHIFSCEKNKIFEPKTALCVPIEEIGKENITELCGDSFVPPGQLRVECVLHEELEISNSDVNISRISIDSKYIFVQPINQNQKGSSFDEIAAVCRNLGLDLPHVKHAIDLQNVEEYLEGKGNIDNSETYWISGIDVQNNGEWLDGEKHLHFQKLWGLSTLEWHIQANNQSTLPPSRLQLRWDILPGALSRQLFMMDLEGNPPQNIFPKNKYLCQYPEDSMCTLESSEERAHLDDSNADIRGTIPMPDIGITLHIFKIQKIYREASSICASQNMTLLETDTVMNSTSFMDEFFQSFDSTEGVWVGPNDVFNPVIGGNWDWLHLQAKDEKTEMNGRRVGHRGKCLVLALLETEQKKFSLINSPCRLPQRFICVEPFQSAESKLHH